MQIINRCKLSDGQIYNHKGIVFASEDVHLKHFLKEYYKMESILYPKFYKMDEQCKLAFIATEVLLQNFAREEYKDEEIAIILANSESTLSTDRSFWESTATIASPALFVYTLPNIMIGEIAIRNKIKGENFFFISKQYDAPLLFQQTELVFQNSSAQAAIVGWVNYENENSYCAKLFLVSKSNRGIDTFSLENLLNI